MKKPIIITLGALALVTGLSTFAAEIESQVAILPMPTRPVTLSAQLSTFDIDAELDYANDVAGGQILRDPAKNTLELILFRRNHCPPHAFCIIEMVRPPVMITLPIVQQMTSDCGAKTYIAVKDLRHVDGNRQSLKLVDNSHRICADYRVGTEITLIEETGGRHGGKTFRSSFTGGIMSPIPVVMGSEN